MAGIEHQTGNSDNPRQNHKNQKDANTVKGNGGASAGAANNSINSNGSGNKNIVKRTRFRAG